MKEIENLNKKMRKAQERLSNGFIDGSDLKIIKLESETGIKKLEDKLADALIAKKSNVNIEPIARQAIERLSRTDNKHYQSSTYQKKS
ncbi:hypothetical protein MTO98_06025 [Mucilaginibacter sp. SMC90]|uniref:hypothetical protein n=1 Tax=Mucilaginibacter sp. SMC90 TaxID=2929803 RepID=UPI001FB493AA|nr:hypothetical protein [Mucilaginibacter sp. SMC90]UOE50629.1 hypothetical protein MTO98_06025 [Mucilaginibacter sp. SMC90]